MPEAKTTTRPRARKAASTTPAKKAAPKTVDGSGTALESVSATETGEVDKLRLSLVQVDDTARYSKFNAPDGSGCVGSLYVPKGAKSVKVLIEM